MGNEANSVDTDIGVYSKLLEDAKTKYSNLKKETESTSHSQNKMTKFLGGFNGKLEQAKTIAGGLKNAFSPISKVASKITGYVKQMGERYKTRNR